MTETWDHGVDLIRDYGTAVEAVTTAVEAAMNAALALPSGADPVETLRLLETTLAAHLKQAFANAVTAAQMTTPSGSRDVRANNRARSRTVRDEFPKGA